MNTLNHRLPLKRPVDPIHARYRRQVRMKVANDLRHRPMTGDDGDQIRWVLLTLAPPCACPQGYTVANCSLPAHIKQLMAMVERSVGRTLTNEEIAALVLVMNDEAAVRNESPSLHTLRSRPNQLCTCGSTSCSECSAMNFVDTSSSRLYRVDLSGNQKANVPMRQSTASMPSVPW